MSVCPNCKYLMVEGAVAFCPHCGAAVDPPSSATLTSSPGRDRALGAGIMAGCWGISAVIRYSAFREPPGLDPTELTVAIFLISVMSLLVGALVWGGTWLAVRSRYPDLYRGYKIGATGILVLALGAFAVCTATLPWGKL